MKIIVCGAGRITDELLKRIGANWEITLIEKNEAKLAPFSNRFPSIVRVLAEDASSPVVLKRAELSAQDGVLAMTNDDAVNLAIVRFAREADIKTVLAVVRDPEMLPAFQELKAWTISMVSDAARKVYQFLKDPRIRIVGLGEGEGELMELAIKKQDLPRLKDLVGSRQNPQWRMIGLLRDNRLMFMDGPVSIEEGDRLLVLGKAELYNAFSSHLADEQLHFPRTYGQRMILGIDEGAAPDIAGLLKEAFYLAQATHIENIKTICEKTASETRNTLARWSESLAIDVCGGETNVKKQMVTLAGEGDAGIAVCAHKRLSFWRAYFSRDVTTMARALACPLLLAKQSDPYERILVPFNGSLAAQRALEIAMDLARQLDAAVSVIIVVEPSFLRGESSASGRWEQEMLKQVRELARIHKIKIEERVRQGNPVKEIVGAATDCQLLVLGGAENRPGFLSVNVAGLIVDRAPCSVLLVS